MFYTLRHSSLKSVYLARVLTIAVFLRYLVRSLQYRSIKFAVRDVRQTYLEIRVQGPGECWDSFEILYNHARADDSIWELRVTFFVMVIQDNNLTVKEKSQFDGLMVLT